MILKQRATLLSLIFLILAVLLSGCVRTEISSGETKVVTDIIGREVEIPKNPERVVCLYAGTAQMLALVDEGEKIIGTTGGIKRTILMRTKYPGIVDAAIPAQEGNINVEELARIEPDLVLLRRSVAQAPGEVEKLEKLGIPYVAVDFFNVLEVEECIKIVGEIFDKQEVSSAYIKYMRDTFSLIDERLEGLSEEEKVRVYHSTNESLKTDAYGGINDEVTRRAGVVNVSINEIEDTGLNTKDATLEQLYEWDPDAIIVNEYQAADYILLNPKWAGLTAVKNKQVIALPVGISRWCHQGSIEPHMGALFVASTLYPERFSDIELEDLVSDYYTQFFEIDLSDGVLERIISGEGMRDPKGS